ncbi:NIPSNAP family protein [Massilia sp. H-1]|nr:NIPSNAP family protein [Massilia sp. H-1]
MVHFSTIPENQGGICPISALRCAYSLDFLKAHHVRLLPCHRTAPLHPGRGGAAARFSRYFETWFPEAFQQLGAMALGHFVERGPGNRFTWLRAYPDMAARLSANTAFYDGPVWREHKATLNHWIVDSDNVLLLRPLYAGAAIPGPA